MTDKPTDKPDRTRANTLPKLNRAAEGDLFDPLKTTDDLVRLLNVVIDEGFRPLLTSIASDHGDDSACGPHCHAKGYGVDLWIAPKDAVRFLDAMANRNRWVTKIGLGGIFRQYAGDFGHGATIVFADNAQDHIHLQTS